MALLILGSGLVDIKGRVGGNIFSRDRSGLHISAPPRRVRKTSTAQKAQRKCFIQARKFSHDNRTVAYNIYRCMNGLSPQAVPNDFYPHMK